MTEQDHVSDARGVETTSLWVPDVLGGEGGCRLRVGGGGYCGALVVATRTPDVVLEVGGPPA